MNWVAYSPNLAISNSYSAIYKIYVLKNPFNNEVFYVGQTMKLVEERLYQHINQEESNLKKVEYIKGILSSGGKPIIETIEVIKSTCYSDKLAVNEREIYWIKYYSQSGVVLLNSASTGENVRCHAWHRYLNSVKDRIFNWEFYFCGETWAGHPVYDVEKIKLDGFYVPLSMDSFLEGSDMGGYGDFKYNPWENSRFIAKIGYRKSTDNKLCYVPFYNDTDPKYYDEDY